MRTNVIKGMFPLWGGLVDWWRCVVVLGVIAVSTGYTGEMATEPAGTDLTICGCLFVGHV